MKHTPTVHRRVSAKDKKKGLLIWAFLLFLGAMTVKGQLDVLYLDAAHAQEASQEAPVELDDRLGEVLDPKGTIVIKEGVDPAWGKIKSPKMAEVSAYTSRVQETDSTPCIPADGSDICKRFAKGEKMVASNDYKLGTKLKIGDLGVFTVVDRMNKRYTGKGNIDIYMGYDLKGARAFGRKNLLVTEL
jgi:3D (Asp-Asp-Asp) domain-containing protein